MKSADEDNGWHTWMQPKFGAILAKNGSLCEQNVTENNFIHGWTNPIHGWKFYLWMLLHPRIKMSDDGHSQSQLDGRLHR